MITMTDQDMEKLSELTGWQLHEFCLYWNPGPVRDGSENIRKGSMINSDRDYRKGYYRRHRLSDGWHLYDHKLGDLVILCDEDEKIRLKGNREEIIGLLRNMVYTRRALRNIHFRRRAQQCPLLLLHAGGGRRNLAVYPPGGSHASKPRDDKEGCRGSAENDPCDRSEACQPFHDRKRAAPSGRRDFFYPD